MSDVELMKLKAAAYALAAQIGTAKAAQKLREVAASLEKDLWDGPGNQ